MEPIMILLHTDCKQLQNTVEQLAASDINLNVHLLPGKKIEDFNLPHADGYVAISDTPEGCRTLREKVIVKNDNSFLIQISGSVNEICFDDANLFIEPKPTALQLAVRCALKQLRLQNKVYAFNVHSVTKEGGMNERKDTQTASQQERFMMMVNHELRTPATIISTSLEMLKMNSSQMSETENRFLENAVSGSRRLNALMQNVLLALPKQPTVKSAERVVALYPFMQQLKNDYLPTLNKRNVRLEVDCPHSLQARVDTVSIRKLFDELLSNALKYSPSGSNIFVQAGLFNGMVTIEVRDRGIGIPKHRLGKVFNAFYQQGDAMKHHSSKTDFMGAGMGLGLTVCKRIVTEHGGQIKAGSLGEGRGSIISLTLPADLNIGNRNSPGYRLAV